MHLSRPGNRAAVTLSLAALIMSAGIAGGPAVAGAIASNSDKVDGKHAVGSGASINQRKGKLVATSPRTGRLPNNIIGRAPDSARLGGKSASYFQKASSVNDIIPIGGAAPGFVFPAAQMTTTPTPVTTLRPGRLLVELTGSGQLACATDSFANWWLTVDGAPIRSSMIPLGEATAIGFNFDGFPGITLSGVTDDVISAGAHTIGMAAACSSGASAGSASRFAPGTGMVTVLNSGFQPPARPLRARQRTCIIDSGGGRCR